MNRVKEAVSVHIKDGVALNLETIETLSKNEVAKLKQEIERLNSSVRIKQMNCEHNFKRTGVFELKSSLVNGVHIALDESDRRKTLDSNQFTIVCVNCALEHTCSPLKMCPSCLHPMVKTHEGFGAGSREKYFGEDHLYYSARLYKCVACDFACVADEWDQ